MRKYIILKILLFKKQYFVSFIYLLIEIQKKCFKYKQYFENTK